MNFKAQNSSSGNKLETRSNMTDNCNSKNKLIETKNASNKTILKDQKIEAQNVTCDKNNLSLLNITSKNKSSNDRRNTHLVEHKQVEISSENSKVVTPTNTATTSNKAAQRCRKNIFDDVDRFMSSTNGNNVSINSKKHL